MHAIYAFKIHPSIFLYPLNLSAGSRGAGAYPSGVHPGQVANPSQGHTKTNETNNHTRSHSLLRTILETPFNLTWMFLDGGRKPEYLERTHALQGEHENSTQKGPSRELNLEPSHCEATVLTTIPPYSPAFKILSD